MLTLFSQNLSGSFTNIVLKADGNYLPEYNFRLSKLSKFSPIWVCDTLIKLYICNDKIHTRKSEVLNFLDKLKFDEKADATSLRNKITVDSAMVHIDSMQDTKFNK